MTSLAWVQVIGFGAAALGLPIAAERRRVLNDVLGAGVVFVDRDCDVLRLARERFSFLIDSNSRGGEFLQAIPLSGPFADLASTSSYRRLAEHARSSVPLRWVGELLSEIQQRVLAEVERHARSRLASGHTITCVKVDRNGLLTSCDSSGAPIATSRYVVFANGARERTLSVGPRAMAARSSDVLRGVWGELPKHVERGAPVHVFGGSHSAFAAGAFLLRTFASHIRDGQIVIFCRRVKLFYESILSAACAGYVYGRDELDPETYELNRFDGLRGDAKALYLAVVGGGERRVQIRPQGDDAQDPDRVVIFAAGYETNHIPLFDATGREVPILDSAGTVNVNEHGQVLDARGRIVPYAFGIGIGYAPRALSGARAVGVNLFHGRAAERIWNKMGELGIGASEAVGNQRPGETANLQPGQ